jgi:hypothetical protein
MELADLRTNYAVGESGVTTAMFRVTNNRSVSIGISAIEIFVVGTNGATTRYYATRSEKGDTEPWGAPRYLKPGEVRHIEAYLPPDFDYWWVYFPAFDSRTQPRMYDWAMRWPPVRWIVEKFTKPIKPSVAKLGPITNRPPATVQVKRDE